MPDLNEVRRGAIRYWERRRIIYNLALVPPAIFSYGFIDNLNWVGDQHETAYSYIVPLFVLSALGANVCYTFAYALEFLFGSDDPASGWMRYGRTTTFVGGLVFAMFLALIGGYNIAQMEWHHGIKRGGQEGAVATHLAVSECGNWRRVATGKCLCAVFAQVRCLPFTEAIFRGPAKKESRNYWIKREGAEDVIVPGVSRFGEKNKTTGEQGWEDVEPGSSLEGLLLPQPPGKAYRLLKVVTQPATPDQIARLGNDRAPVVLPPSKAPP